MFGRIAARYDLLNRVLSLGVDQRWRRRLLEQSGDLRGRPVVDLCCGTGDVSLLLARAGARVVGIDFTPQMLARAEHKRRRAAQPGLFASGDALALPVADRCAEVCTVAFGIRNVADRQRCLREMRRVLAPGGRGLVLEFSLPPGRLFGWIYRTYFTRVLPWIGRLVSRDADAYSYLPRTVLSWPAPHELQREMEQAGFVDCSFTRLSFGIACVHSGRAAAT